MADVDDLVSIQELRAELKQWEKSFALAHDGRKPTRDDIKSNGSISDKYRLFNRLSRPQTAPPAHQTPQKNRGRRVLSEKSGNNSILSPQLVRTKQSALAFNHEEEIEPTPAHIRCALGPTPQKDGIVLGIFDLFGNSATPTRKDAEAHGGTPSKHSHMPPPTSQSSRTPQSSSKRFYLDAFAGTPLKRKREDESQTPSVSRQQFDTPAFLRRDISFENAAEDDARPPSKRRAGARKGVARTFSSILAGLRKQEDERMDEEWDIMRELEAEVAVDHGESAHKETRDTMQVENSQGIEMPLGPDRPMQADDESDDKQAASRKPWKKKGLKRQTKKSNMKPVLHAPQKAAELSTSHAEHDDGVRDGPAQDGINKVSEGVKKTMRKVNEAAHMNFRRLKIKNKNSKAKGRFGRR